MSDMEAGRLEAVLAMADALDTSDERRAVVAGYQWDRHYDLAWDAQHAWSTLVVAEHVVLALYDHITYGTFTWRDGKEI